VDRKVAFRFFALNAGKLHHGGGVVVDGQSQVAVCRIDDDALFEVKSCEIEFPPVMAGLLTKLVGKHEVLDKGGLTVADYIDPLGCLPLVGVAEEEVHHVGVG
jgi:hypothetical protein